MIKFLFRTARLLIDIKTISSGNPKRIGKRARNKIIGRQLWRLFK